MAKAEPRLLRRDDLDALIAALARDGAEVIGPTIRDGAIVFDRVVGADDLPHGWTDEQAPGRYRLRRRDDDRAFGYAVGPHSWKRQLFPATERLHTARRDGGEVSFEATPVDAPPRVFLGVRACDLAAMAVQDRVFTGGPYVDGRYEARRDRAFVVAVQCTEAGDLCFCASMGTGPAVGDGADLVLTELDDGFVARADTDRGQAVLDALPTGEATDRHQAAVDAGVAACEASMGRAVDTSGLPELLLGNLDHPRWDDVASRCLSCANCTLVCPTCFCFSVRDVSDLTGTETARERSWTSCFTAEHSRIHGGAFRPRTRDRYRQWLTHKVATWHAQFDTTGCVGCGRCIAWCPAGIDMTEELAALRADAEPGAPFPSRPSRPAPRATADPLTPEPARVVGVTRETSDVVTLHVEPPPGYSDHPGQFNMLGLPGIGEVPISVASESFVSGGTIAHTVRAVGAATTALCALSPGDGLGLRGPFGSAWPLEEARGRDVVVVAGGVGLPPVRGVLRTLFASPGDYGAVRLFYGARTPADIPYGDELRAWMAAGHRVAVTVDRAGAGWTGNVGVVTTLMRRKDLPPGAIYMIVGPEVMMKFVLRELHAAGVPDEHVFLSMERRMQCAIGQCGQCQYGPHFICRDGPVFRFDQVAHLFDRHGW